jgi:hypothetical protein
MASESLMDKRPLATGFGRGSALKMNGFAGDLETAQSQTGSRLPDSE